MNRTAVDWWSWRSKAPTPALEKSIRDAFSDSGHPLSFHPRKGGFLGFERSFAIKLADMDVGIVGTGGESQEGWTFVSISGQGCQWVGDWDLAQQAAEDSGSYEVKRVDIALDVFDGSSDFDQTLAAYRSEGFNLKGRPPKCEPMKPERPEDSAIIKIGKRSSDKYFRGYEKGKQLLGPVFAAAQAKDADFALEDFCQERITRVVDGRLVALPMLEWWRMELELKPKSAPLPDDVIDRRDQYFAGAYPYLGQVLSGVDPEPFVQRRERGPQLELALALAHIQKQFGSTLFTALHAHDGDILAVWDQIVGSKHSARLLEAGVLMVDHR